jgi:hypothetical protein
MKKAVFFIILSLIFQSAATVRAASPEAEDVMDAYRLKLEAANVTASSYDNEGYRPSRALDGETGTMWHSRGVGVWLKIELKEDIEMGAVGIAFNAGNTVKYNFTLQVSQTDSSYETVYNGMSYLSNTCYFNFQPKKVKFIKITMNGSSASLNNGIRNVTFYSGSAPKATVLNFGWNDITALYDYNPQNPPRPQCRFAIVGEMTDKPVKGTAVVRVMYAGEEQVSEKTYNFRVAPGIMDDLYCTLDPVKEPGWYTAQIDLYFGDALVSRSPFGFGVIRKAAEGLRPDSPFALNFRLEGNQDVNRLIGQKIGVKWSRSFPYAEPALVKPTKNSPYWDEPGNTEGVAYIKAATDEIRKYREAGITVTGSVNYNMPWNITPLEDGTVPESYQNKPLDIEAQAEMVYHLIKPFYGLVDNWEIWNEPWVHGWTWRTGDAQDYRDMQKLIWDKIKPEMPDINLIAGGSTAYQRDIVYASGADSVGYSDGSVNHAYTLPSMALVSALMAQRNMDKENSVSGGAGGMWQTEGGNLPGSLPGTPFEQQMLTARNVAPSHLQNLFVAGGEVPMKYFWFALSYGAGFSGGEHNMYDVQTKTPFPCVVSYSAMTHFLEDTDYKDEAFPNSKSTWGYVFERKSDKKATAAVYSATGYNGTMVIENAQGIKAYDFFGKEIAGGTEDRLEIPLLYWKTVYLVSDLTAEELRAKLSGADMEYDNLLVAHPQNFMKPLDSASTIDIKLENVTNKAVSGTVNLTPPEGWELKSETARFESLESAETRIVSLPVKTFKTEEINRYNIEYEITFDHLDAVQKGEQTIQVTYAPRKTIRVGNLSDWDDVLPVTMVSNGTLDAAAVTMDPSMAEDLMNNDPTNSDKVMYTVKTAWDKNNFYFYARVPDVYHHTKVRFRDDEYLFPWDFDCVQLGFKPLEVNPDDPFAGHPYAYKGLKAGIDYEYALNALSNGGTEIYRTLAPGTKFQNYYPTNPDTEVPVGAIDAGPAGGKDGKLIISRDGANKLTTYECAISWDNIKELGDKVNALKPGELTDSLFAFAIGDRGDNNKGTSFWSKEMNCVELLAERGLAPIWSNRSGNINTRWGFYYPGR